MKRIRIWLSNFTLIQQFLAIVLFTGAVLLFFIFTYLNRNIDTFVNSQMYVYIHRSQNEYLETRIYQNDSNVIQFVYNAKSDKYLNNISDYENLLSNIDPESADKQVDSSFTYNENTIVYSIVPFDEDFRLVSIVKNNFREEFRNALSSGVINMTFYVIFALIFLIVLWILSLIRPLDSITDYINRIRNGEKATMKVQRYDEIGRVAEAIVEMNDELAKQQHIRDEMIQNISHDLKTPIATIKSYSESIKDGVYPYGTLEKSADVIIENASRLEKKVYSLITYNKLGYLEDKDEGILNLRMAPIINKTIMASEALRKEIVFETNIDEDVYFHGEEEAWMVVIENIIDNALRYAKSVIKVDLSDNLLEIYNDGEPIEKDRLDKLFKPYEKGNKGKFGLGLSIVKRVTETYGYTVTGENMSDGVVFRIYTTKKMKKLPKKRKDKKKDIIE